MSLLSFLPAREAADIWKRFCSDGPSANTLVRLPAKAGKCLEGRSTEVMAKLQEQ